MRHDGVMMATTRRALCNPVTILSGGRDLADMQDMRNMGDSPVFVENLGIIFSQSYEPIVKQFIRKMGKSQTESIHASRLSRKHEVL